MSKKFSLFYAWGSTNAGDHALTLGAVSLIRLAEPNADITVVTRYGVDEDEHSVTEQKLLDFDKQLTVYPSPFRGSNQSRWTRFISGASQAILSLALPKLSRKIYKSKPAFAAVESCDWALQNGGNLYYWNANRKSPSRLFAFGFPLRLAKSRGASVGFLPQTVGKLEGGIGTKFANFISTADFVMFRDSDSQKHLREAANVEPRNSCTVPDLVYFMPQQSLALAAETLEFPDKFIAVTLRDESLGDYGVADYEEDRHATRERILSLYPAALATVKAKFNLPFVIVVQVSRDAEISRQLCDKLNKQGITATVLECYDPPTLISLYGHASILIAQRLHSQIFAFNSGTPSIGLWRERLGTKIPSMMSDMNCERFCLKFDEVSPDTLSDRVIDLIERKQEIALQCKTQLDARKQKTIKFLQDQFTENE